jgi:phosphoglycolate phosphatase
MKNRFELIIFDWDGTLCNSIDGIVSCLRQSAANLKLEPPSIQDSRNVIGLSLTQAMMELFPRQSPQVIDALVNEYRALYLSGGAEADPLFDGVPELLVNLRDAGYQLAVATGKSRRGLNQAMVSTEMVESFDLSCCGDESASKPAPDMLYKLLTESGVKAEKALMIGDSWLDLEMARNAGVASVAVSSGVHRRDELVPYNPLLCVDEVRHLATSLL